MIDPLGLDWLDTLGNTSAGFGDSLTSGFGASYLFGLPSLTEAVRDGLGIDDMVDKCSGAYGFGEHAAAAWAAAAGAGASRALAQGAARGLEFSHWIPARLGGPRSLWNGNFVSVAEHALSDPWRYRFMPRKWTGANPMPGRISQQWNRLPNALKAAGLAGALAEGMLAATNPCECR